VSAPVDDNRDKGKAGECVPSSARPADSPERAAGTIPALVDRAAASFADRVAFRDEDMALTFADLRAMARGVADRLEGPTTPVAVLLPKAPSTVAVYLGAAYAARPYVPLDDKTPPARLAAILETLGDCTVLSDTAGCERLTGSDELRDVLPRLDLIDVTRLLVPGPSVTAKLAAEPARLPAPDDTAYIMFTSGSTGVPKGVAVTHAAVCDYGRWVADTFGFDATSVLGNQAAFYFANSLFDIYGTLSSGATCVLVPTVLYTFPSKLPAYLADAGVTDIFWVPTVMKNIANSGVLDTVRLPRLRHVNFCGEILSNAYLNVWRRALPDVQFANLYGMTESADACCWYAITRDFADSEPLPAGQARAGMAVCVLDTAGAAGAASNAADVDESADEGRCVPVAAGQLGEICVSGTGLAAGYWARDDLTRAAFFERPDGDGVGGPVRWYRTGDLGYIDADGLLYVKGRRDSQVKVKGNRVELGEVERAASTLDCADNVCVLFDPPPAEQIVLFVQPAAGALSDALRLRRVNQQLKQLIPDYMLPARIEVLDAFPLTPSGKIDRMQLRTHYNLV
jgi:amino acid adenylation domain-containing protein